jgi:hypothetical protein
VYQPDAQEDEKRRNDIADELVCDFLIYASS